MRDHLTFDLCVYLSRPIRFSRTLVYGLVFVQADVILPILPAASPLAFSASGSAVRTLPIPPATQATTKVAGERVVP